MANAQYPRCASCGSKQPHLHPAVQFEGEVQLCTDEFHLRPTTQNRAAYISAVQAKRALINKAEAA